MKRVAAISVFDRPGRARGELATDQPDPLGQAEQPVAAGRQRGVAGVAEDAHQRAEFRECRARSF